MLSRRHALSCIAMAMFLALSLVPLTKPAGAQGGGVAVTDLEVENAPTPLGLDTVPPRFSWRLEASRNAVLQSAYQVQVGSDADELAAGSADVWDSGEVSSSDNAQVRYAGPALASETRYHWRVRVWDEAGVASAWSEPSWFETGIADEGWSAAEWISHVEDIPWPSFDDFELTMQATVDNGALGVFFRYDESSSGYMWQIRNTANGAFIRPHTRTNGGYASLGDFALGEVDVTQPFELTIAAEGSTITTSIDGVEVDSREHTAFSAGTIGFRTSGSEAGRVDDVTVTQSDTVVFSADFTDDNPFAGGEIVDGELDVSGDTLLVPPPPASPRLREEFILTKPVAQARLYMSGLGYSVAHLNGSRVGTAVLDPGQTDYSDSVHYTAADVTDLVQQGANAIGVELGRGFYGMGTGSSWNWNTAPWWSDPELRAVLRVHYTDGSTRTVASNGGWTTSGDGPIRYDETFAGETYDARFEQPGWATAAYDEAAWGAATVVEGPSGAPRPQLNEPIRVTETIQPASITEPEPGVYVVDLGVQIAGWAQLTVQGPAGTSVSMAYGERLGEDGLVNVPSWGQFHSTPRAQTDIYVLGGNGREVWEPSFTYKGFRFIEVRGLPEPPTATTVVGRRVHNDFASVGDFDSSEPLLNQIRSNVRRALLNNHQHVPTDTPVYEKAGWTGDAQLTASTAAYEFDMTRFHTKYMTDFVDAQLESGELPTIIPTAGWSYEGQPGWGAVHGPTPAWDASLFVIPWNLYENDGDTSLLEMHFDGMQRYFSWLLSYAEEDGTLDVGLGDWVAVGGNPPEGPALSSTAHAYFFATRIVEVAEVLGDTAAVATYTAEAERLRTLFNDVFFDAEAGIYRTPLEGNQQDYGYRQTSNAIAVAFGLVPDDRRQEVVDNLAADVAAQEMHLNTGIIGARYVMEVLSLNGHIDTAYAIATQTTYPSWGYWIVELGRTSMQEHWHEGTRSLNHHMFATIGRWLYADLVGIRPGAPGWSTVQVRPFVPSDLASAEASTETVRGIVSAAWEQDDDGLALDVTVPANAVGEIHVPLLDFGPDDVVAPSQAEMVAVEDGFAVHTIGSGTWRFTVGDVEGAGNGGGGGGGGTPGGQPTEEPTDEPTDEPTEEPAGSEVDVLSGASRVETAVAISQASFPTDGSADAVVLARADVPFDALAATPLAADKNGPLLLTQSTELHPAALAEIQRVLPAGGTVWITGGESALSAGVAEALTEAGFVVARLSGPSRVETALAVADEIGDPAAVLVASAESFADALSAGAAAAAADGLVVLTGTDALHPAVQAYLAGLTGVEVHAVGGPAAAVAPDATPHVGSGREATSVLVAEAFFDGPPMVGVARNDDPADALSGGAHAALAGGPVLLTGTDLLHPTVEEYLCSQQGADGFVYGGPSAISPSVVDAITARLGGSGCAA